MFAYFYIFLTCGYKILYLANLECTSPSYISARKDSFFKCIRFLSIFPVFERTSQVALPLLNTLLGNIFPSLLRSLLLRASLKRSSHSHPIPGASSWMAEHCVSYCHTSKRSNESFRCAFTVY